MLRQLRCFNVSMLRTVFLCLSFPLLVCLLWIRAPGDHRLLAQETPTRSHLAARYEGLLLRQPRPGSTLDRLYRYSVEAQSFSDLLERLTPSAEDRSPEAGRRLLLKGLLQHRDGQPHAVESLQAALGLLPNDPVALQNLAIALDQQGEPTAAAKYFDAALKQGLSPTEALPIYLSLGRIYYQHDQDEQAAELWERFQRQFSGQPNAMVQVANVMLQQQRLSAAVELYQQLAATAPPTQELEFRLTAAQLRHRAGESEHALADLQQLLQRVRPGSYLEERISQTLEPIILSQHGHDGLVAHYARQFQQQPDNISLGLRLGRLQLRRNDAQAAHDVIQPLLKADRDNVALRMSFVEALERLGRWAEVASQYALLVEQQPQRIEFRMAWGRAVVADTHRPVVQRHAEAVQIWRQIVEQPLPGPAVLVEVAQLLTSVEHDAVAEPLLRRAVRQADDALPYLETLGRWLHQRGRRDEAIETWMMILKPAAQASSEQVLLVVDLLIEFAERDAAARILNMANDRDWELDERLAVADRLLRVGEVEAAEEQLRQTEPLAESSVQLRRVWRQQMQVATAAGFSDRLIRQVRSAVAERPDDIGLLQKVAVFLSADNQFNAAILPLRQALGLRPDDPELLQALAQMQQQSGQGQAAIESYNRLLQVDSRGQVITRRKLVELHRNYNQMDAAMEHVRQLINQQPADVTARRLLAELHFEKGQAAEGFAAYEAALQVAPQDQGLRLDFARALATEYRTESAIDQYWLAWENSRDLSQRADILAALAPLYDRMLRIDELLQRLQMAPALATGKEFPLPLQQATVWEAVGNHGAAALALESLLLERPDDTDLVRRRIRLAFQMRQPDEELHWIRRWHRMEQSDASESGLIDGLIRTKRFAELSDQVVRFAKAGDDAAVHRWCRQMLLAGFGERTVQTMQAVIAQVPERPLLGWQLAVLQWMTGNQAAARAALASVQADIVDLPPQEPLPETVVRTTAMLELVGDSPQQWLRWFVQQRTLDLDLVIASIPILARMMEDSEAQTGPLPTTATPGQTKGDQAVPRLWALFWDAASLEQLTRNEQQSISNGLHADAQRAVLRLAIQLSQRSSSAMNAQHAREQALQVLLTRHQMQRAAAGSIREPLPESDLAWLHDCLERPDQATLEVLAADYWAALLAEYLLAGDEASAQQLLAGRVNPGSLTEVPVAIELLRSSGAVDQLIGQLSQWRQWLRELPVDHDIEPQTLQTIAAKLEAFARPAAPEAALLLTVDQRYQIVITILAIEAVFRQQDLRLEERWNEAVSRAALQASSSTYEVSPLLGSRLTVAGVRLLHDPRISITRQLQQKLMTTQDGGFYEQWLAGALVAAQWTWGEHADRRQTLQTLAEMLRRCQPSDDSRQQRWCDELRGAYALQLERVGQSDAASEQWREVKADEPALRERKYLSLVRIASYAGDNDLALSSLEVLKTLSIDRDTRSVVRGQLLRLGLREQAEAFAPTQPGHQAGSLHRPTVGKSPPVDDSRAAAEHAYERLTQHGEPAIGDVLDRLKAFGVLPVVDHQWQQRLKQNPNSEFYISRLAEIQRVLGDEQGAQALRARQVELQRSRRDSTGDVDFELKTALQAIARREFSIALDHFLNVFSIDSQRIPPHLSGFIQAAQMSKRMDAVWQHLVTCDLSRWHFGTLRELMDLDPEAMERPSPPQRQWMTQLLLHCSDEQFGPLLKELRRPQRLGASVNEVASQRLQAWLTEGHYWDPEAVFWRQGAPNSDGRFEGNLSLLAELLTDSRALGEAFKQRAGRWDNHPERSAIALVVRILSGDDREAVEALAKDHHALTGTLAWQLADLGLQRRNLPPSLCESLYQQALADRQILRSQRRFNAGVAERLLRLVNDQRGEQAAMEFLRSSLVRLAGPEGQPTSLEDQQDLVWIAQRLQDANEPLDYLQAADLAGRLADLAQRHAIVQTLGPQAYQAFWDQWLEWSQQTASSDWNLRPLRPRLDAEPWQAALVTWAVYQAPPASLDFGATNNLNSAATQLLLDLQADAPEGVARWEANLRQLSQDSVPGSQWLQLWPLARIAASHHNSDWRVVGEALCLQLLDCCVEPITNSLRCCLLDSLLTSRDPATARTGEQRLDKLLRATLRSRDLSVFQVLPWLELLIKHQRFEQAGKVLQVIEPPDSTEPEASVQQVINQALQRFHANWMQAEDATADAADWLVSLLFPPDRPDRINLRLDVSSTSADSSAGSVFGRQFVTPPPFALAIVVTVAAHAGGQDARFMEELSRRSTHTGNELPAAVLQATMAAVSDDFPGFQQAWQAICQQLDGLLLPLDQLPAAADNLPPWTKTIQAMQASERLLRVAELLLIPSMIADCDDAIFHMQQQIRLQVAAMLIVDRGALRQNVREVQSLLGDVQQQARDENLAKLAEALLTKIAGP